MKGETEADGDRSCILETPGSGSSILEVIGIKRMNARTIILIALCATLAACNSKPPEQVATSTEAAGQSVETPAAASTPAVASKPAPEGLPSRVAREVIAASGQKCDGVSKADRDVQDGSIVASCTSGESYRIYTVEGKGAVATKF